jgi:hypothetical protein
MCKCKGAFRRAKKEARNRNEREGGYVVRVNKSIQ